MFDLKVMVMLACPVFAASAAEAGSWKPVLDPTPSKVNILAGSYRPKVALVIKAAGVDIPAAKRAARTLACELRKQGFDPSVSNALEGRADVTLSITDDLSFGEQGYRLMVGDTISIVAATDEGLAAGTHALLQLLSAGPNVRIRRVRIED